MCLFEGGFFTFDPFVIMGIEETYPAAFLSSPYRIQGSEVELNIHPLVMAKKSQKRSVRFEKDQLGCMSGFISIFDFRHGRPTWKLISDRRHGSTGLSRNQFEMLRNLDKNFQGTLDGDVSTTAIVTADACKPSVKKLMEEEMSIEQDTKKEISNDEAETKQSDSSQIRKDNKKPKKTRKKSRDMDTHNLNASENSESVCSCNQNPEQKTRSNFGIDEIREEVRCQIHQKYINCANHDVNGEAPAKSNYKHSDFEELCVAIKEFMNQKFTDGKHLTEDQKIHHFRELMDALEVLSSDEELFLKLLRDPNSLLAKYVQNLQDAQIEKDEESQSFAESKLSEQKLGDLKQPEELVIRKHRYFFRRKIKPQERNPTKANENSEASKRIVILKPGPPGLRNLKLKIAHPQNPITLQGIKGQLKEKFKNAMGKQQHGASTVGISNRLPYKRQSLEDSDRGVGKEKAGSSPGKEHFYMERIAKPSSGIKRVDKTGKVKESEISLEHENHGILDQRVSNIYIEAKKHLSEMLSNGDEVVDISRRQFPKTLGRILSLPDYNISPFGSPGRDLENGFVTAHMRLSAYDKVWKANENTWSPKQEKNASPLSHVAPNLESLPSVSDSNPDYKVQPPNSIPSNSDNLVHDNEVEETHPTIVDEMNPEGDIEIEKEIEIVAQEEEIIVDVPSEPSGSSIARDDETGDMPEISDDKRYSECSRQLFNTKHFEDLERAIDIAERPSPVSVLEPLFTDDDISPAKTISRRVELPIQPLQIQFEDHDPSATEQTNNAKTCTEDKEVIFDFVKSVMQAYGFNWDDICVKWLSSDQLIEPSLCDEVELFPNQLCYDQNLLFDCINEVLVEASTDMKTAIHEVWTGVYWHLLPLPLPHTLDQIVTKDMSRTGTWMDLRFDTETIGVDMGEAILQELMEDTILSYVDGSPKSENALVLAESNEKDSILNL
ncbi:Protein of unknown function D [Prunus dulcis]|uniref:DUF4378 domain-containing protein n=1 Tax=Prunus dulcis TaxID=3755 RepID=A0A5H2XR33_PRUDU|nr:Protein of unknown function D [Prunus dulcis]